MLPQLMQTCSLILHATRASNHLCHFVQQNSTKNMPSLTAAIANLPNLPLNRVIKAKTTDNTTNKKSCRHNNNNNDNKHMTKMQNNLEHKKAIQNCPASQPTEAHMLCFLPPKCVMQRRQRGKQMLPFKLYNSPAKGRMTYTYTHIYICVAIQASYVQVEWGRTTKRQGDQKADRTYS